MKVVLTFKGENVNTVIREPENVKAVLRTLSDSENGKLVYENEEMYLDYDFSDIESFQVIFE